MSKVPLGRTSTWNCKEEIIRIKEARTDFMNETGRLCIKIDIISSNTVRIVVGLATAPNGNFVERILAVILGIVY
jgi:hypothetical protein